MFADRDPVFASPQRTKVPSPHGICASAVATSQATPWGPPSSCPQNQMCAKTSRNGKKQHG